MRPITICLLNQKGGIQPASTRQRAILCLFLRNDSGRCEPTGLYVAAFLNQMLEGGVDAALYLVTTDLRQPAQDAPGRFENVWGWPGLFVNRNVFGEPVSGVRSRPFVSWA